ncbi:hypothetical protein [Sulfurisoma sediminicola]|uniref:Uncharacterized protein n=1 Tax=Sulfurisoma sediminicola TaxID=1381557 RepID=A0A497XLK5_9PROT|nr:hypothetical protein [Sulfurisoma sediminicola]RLJ68270.1 hypothetical protein DFR35_0828 [Sulfurisoma sediminicola]
MSKEPAATTPPTGLRQLNANYVALEDRIRLSLTTQDGNEFRFWLTRRYLQLLWQALGRVVTRFAELKAAGDPLLQSALAGFAEARAMNRADLSTPYEAGANFPLGESPMLLSRVTVGQITAAGTQPLTLRPEQGAGIDLALNEELAHVLCNLLRQAAIAAEWGLNLDAALAASPAGTAAGALLLH